MERYYGKYRGRVTNNSDPHQRGRVEVSVPQVLGANEKAWALPCVPFAGPGLGVFALPPVGASVWVEFEAGNPDHPIYVGGFWEGDQPLPLDDPGPMFKAMKTDGVSLLIDDTPRQGSLSLEVGPPIVPFPLSLVMNSGGITLTSGSAEVSLDRTTVSLNGDGLKVT